MADVEPPCWQFLPVGELRIAGLFLLNGGEFLLG